MIYEVTYQIEGEERTDRVDAPDAAGAVASVRDAHGPSPDRFELLLVHLVDEPAPIESTCGFDGYGLAQG